MTEAPKRVAVRTPRQNRALHLFFRMLAGGYSVKIVLAKKLDCDWNPALVKDLIWRPAQRAVLGKESTRLLAKSEDIDKVYETINRFVGQEFGVHVDWPHFEKGEYEAVTASTV